MNSRNSVHVRNKVLVAADEPDDRSLIRESLQAEGFEVTEASNGQQALTLFDEIHPDLVVMDAELPDMDGFEACTRIRELPHGRGVAIVMVSTLCDAATVDRAYQVGATDMIGKPLNPVLLGHRVNYILRASKALVELQASRARNSALLKAIPDLALVVGRDGVILDVLGRRHSDAMPYSEELPGKSVHTLWPQEVAETTCGYIKRTLMTREDHSYEFQLKHEDTASHCEARFMVHGRDRVLMIVRDITDKKSADSRINDLAYFDPLTGLPNRQMFLRKFERGLSAAQLTERGLAILRIDLNDIKRINDTLGRVAGDAILKAASQRLAQCIREADCVARVGEENETLELARWGGDEFTMLLTNMDYAENAATVATRIRETLLEPLTYEAHEILVTPRVGISMYPQDGTDIVTLLRNADTARCEAGEDGQKFYSDSIRTRSLRRLDRANELRDALEQEHLQLYYQPKIAVDTGKVVGLEALLRWIHPLRGPVPSAEFIPLAEETGLIMPIGDWVLRSACEQAVSWQSRGWGRLPIAVNLSSREFLRSSLLAHIASILKEAGIDAGCLELEFTESTLMRDVGAAVATLQKLRELGVGLAVDDFGTGHSSLNCLREFPIDAVKIDCSFVRELETDADNRAICSSIIAMAHQFDVTVIAEGVETEADLQVLRAEGCDQMQGYLCTEALPADELAEFLVDLGDGNLVATTVSINQSA